MKEYVEISEHLFLEEMGREWEGGGKGGHLYEGGHYPMGRESGGNKMAEPEQIYSLLLLMTLDSRV